MNVQLSLQLFNLTFYLAHVIISMSKGRKEVEPDGLFSGNAPVSGLGVTLYNNRMRSRPCGIVMRNTGNRPRGLATREVIFL